jgi:hypothetical protein
MDGLDSTELGRIDFCPETAGFSRRLCAKAAVCGGRFAPNMVNLRATPGVFAR